VSPENFCPSTARRRRAGGRTAPRIKPAKIIHFLKKFLRVCPPQADFLPRPASGAGQSKVSVRIFAEKSSDFVQETQHYTIFSFFRSVLRLAASRLGAEMGQISETFFRPGGEKKF